MTDTELVALRDELARIYGEDIAQETILKLLEAQASGVVFERPDHWARKTAYGLTKHDQRRRGRVVLVGDLHPENIRPSDQHVGNWGGRVNEALTQGPMQLGRLEARETLQTVDPRLVNEVIEGVPKMSKDSRKRVRRQASPHPHRPRTTRPGRCSECGLGKDAGVHQVARRDVA